MANNNYGKERVALFTKYFVEDGKPISVKKLMAMFEEYSGEMVKRQTVYNDLNAIDVVIPLSRIKREGSREWLYFRDEEVLK